MNAVEFTLRNGHSVNFYKFNNDLYMEITNSVGTVIGSIKVENHKKEELLEQLK